MRNEKQRNMLNETAPLINVDRYQSWIESAHTPLAHEDKIYAIVHGRLRYCHSDERKEVLSVTAASVKEFANQIIHLPVHISNSMNFFNANVSKKGVLIHNFTHIFYRFEEFTRENNNNSSGHGDEMLYSFDVSLTLASTTIGKAMALGDDYLITGESYPRTQITLFFENQLNYFEALLLVNSDA